MAILKPKLTDYVKRRNLPAGTFRFRVMRVNTTKSSGEPLVTRDGFSQLGVSAKCENPPSGGPFWPESTLWLTYDLNGADPNSYNQFGDPRELYIAFCTTIDEDPTNTDTSAWLGKLFLGEVREWEGADGTMKSSINKVAKSM